MHKGLITCSSLKISYLRVVAGDPSMYVCMYVGGTVGSVRKYMDIRISGIWYRAGSVANTVDVRKWFEFTKRTKRIKAEGERRVRGISAIR